jgi:hypothetical protein
MPSTQDFLPKSILSLGEMLEFASRKKVFNACEKVFKDKNRLAAHDEGF